MRAFFRYYIVMRICIDFNTLFCFKMFFIVDLFAFKSFFNTNADFTTNFFMFSYKLIFFTQKIDMYLVSSKRLDRFQI